MWPALFRVPLPEFLGGGHFPIRMFGVMVILGFLAGTWVFSRRMKRHGLLSPEDAFDFCFYLLATGILGSRLCYVLQNFSDFKGRFFRIFAIWEGGLVWYGGFALATLFAFWWLWKKKLPVLKVTDAAALAVAMGLFVGRFGCFFAGDDYGDFVRDAAGDAIRDAAAAPWYAVQFPAGGPDANWRYQYSEVPLSHRAPYWVHPVQLYLSFKNLVVFGVLAFIAGRMRRTGTLTAAYLLLYPLARFVVEFWRGDADRGVDVLGTGLSFSQFFGVAPFLLGVAVWRRVLQQPEEPDDGGRAAAGAGS